MKHLGDITKLQGAELPPVDVVVGGSPCQNLSVAGNRMGLEGSESRLFYDYVRVVKEMRDADRAKGRTDEFIRPRYLVFENVFGALNSNKGKDFQIILTEIARVARPDCPDVPIPERGGVAQIRVHLWSGHLRLPLFHRLEITRRTVLGKCPL